MALNRALYSENVITGDDYNYLSYRLKQSIQRAERIDIIIAFLMESGVKMLIKDLHNAIDRGIRNSSGARHRLSYNRNFF